MTSPKPTNMNSSSKLTSDDIEETAENSFCVTKMVDLLETQSSVSVTDILKLQKMPGAKKQPVLERNSTIAHSTILEVQSKEADTASSADTVETVISIDHYKKHENTRKVPKVIISPPDFVVEEGRKKVTRSRSKSKSPSSRSPSTVSTVRDNVSESPNCSNGGTKPEKPKCFPIKSNAVSLSWMRAGRKEVSLKNSLSTNIQMFCQIEGDEFAIDLPGFEARRGSYVLPFNANERRLLPIVFTPKTCKPYSATLHIVQDADSSRAIMLNGCVSGEPVRWWGHTTYSETAAVIQAKNKSKIQLTLRNKSTMPAFVAAKVQFNLQYTHVEQFSSLRGANSVIVGGALHTITLKVDWARVRRRAESATGALATVTVLTGAETTRQRILKILKDNSKEKYDVSLLPEHVRVIAQEFHNEDSEVENLLTEFCESKASLSELVECGLEELSAAIELPRFGNDADTDTIVISDEEDTVVFCGDTLGDEHHTLL